MQSVLRFFAAVVAAMFLAHAVQAHEDHLPQVEGLIKKIDAPTGTVTIAHAHIPNLDMPPMTMSFKAKDPAMLGKWKAGDKVRFRSADVKGTLTVFTIDAAK